jgi:hypothetical protein
MEATPLVSVLAQNVTDGLRFRGKFSAKTWEYRIRQLGGLSPSAQEALLQSKAAVISQAEERARSKGETAVFDRLLGISGWKPPTADGIVDADVFEAGWPAYMAVQKDMGGATNILSPQHRKRGLQRLLTGEGDPIQVPSLGVNITVELADGAGMRTARDEHVRFGGAYTASANEGGNVDDVVDTGDGRLYLPEMTIRRVLHEEMGISLSPDQPTPKFVVHTMTLTSTGDMGLLAHVNLGELGIDSGALEASIERAEDGWELRNRTYFPWDSDGLNELIRGGLEDDRWLPWALLHYQNSALASGVEITPVREIPNVVENLGLELDGPSFGSLGRNV